MIDSTSPYRVGLRAGVASGLAAAALLAVADVAQAASGSQGLGFALPVLALWLGCGVVVGVGLGLVAGAVAATWGAGAVRRGLGALQTDAALDRAVAAGILAGFATLALLALAIARLALALVAGVERQQVGALLVGACSAVAIPLFALVAIVLSRATRHVVAAVPRTARIPRTLMLLAIAIVGGAAAVLGFIFLRLDWRVLGLGSLLALAALPVLALSLFWLGTGIVGKGVARLPGARHLLPVGVILTVLLPLATLRGVPSRNVQIAVTDHSLLGSRLIPRLGRFFDRDRDGFSTFFGGIDCDDTSAAVNPGAREVPGNGIDDDCSRGDRAVEGHDAGAEPAPPGGERLVNFDGNVLFIMIDTLRADRLGVAGYRRDGTSLTPRLDQLAATSTWFSRTYAQAPNTPRSLPSLFAARYPSQIAMAPQGDKNYPTVSDANVLLFEKLTEAGLHTVGITSHFYFCDEARQPGLCAGFKKPKNSQITQGAIEWDNQGVVDVAPSNKDVAAPRIVPRAVSRMAELAARSQRFAMFVHLFEPHSTYVEHEGWPVTERETAGLVQKYDYEIAFTDRWVGDLLDGLKAAKLDDKTLVVVVSDHGEAFGQHHFAGQRMFFHGQTLYDELIRVPLLIHVPGSAPRQHDGVVETIDVAPTILDVLGIARPSSWTGRSLAPVLAGQSLAEKPAFAELLAVPAWNHQARAMVTGDGKWKLFHRIGDGRFELYNLADDPGETRDRYAAEPELARKLTDQLLDWAEAESGQTAASP
jgi:arylsulfatase A-like enzyme